MHLWTTHGEKVVEDPATKTDQLADLSSLPKRDTHSQVFTGVTASRHLNLPGPSPISQNELQPGILLGRVSGVFNLLECLCGIQASLTALDDPRREIYLVIVVK